MAAAVPAAIPLVPAPGTEPVAAVAPVAMIGVAERHDPAADFGRLATPVAAVETHETSLASLDKAARLAERIAALADLRTAAAAQGAPQVAVSDAGVAYAFPTVGRLTSAAGPRWGGTHYGMDIANRVGTPIFAVADGVVVDSGPASGFGLWVRIRHSDGSLSVYGHIDRSLVRQGQSVRAGDRIALMGNRGQSTGPHLHLEIWAADGARADPGKWLARRGLSVEAAPRAGGAAPPT
ncbi:M23 family metallopeptidase [Pseudonocardia sp. WMMC193]|uniref:M23 family metallopeptidase n=1 Tax=Pseudonocardia sp. WMMC193 TaxID=2911965 RepID=UPI001F37FAD0|nr:M23 family metallopeptidase [Pseudonocardia sp. WMMC193]MCF7553753.1 M23 family metallopeptidase [Pseudonocardia sp. WMMC193]